MRREYIAWFDMPNSGKLHGQSVMPKQELIRCKDCARNDNCFMYRESGNDDGFCAWADKREE